jgi:hypothetical protein
MGALPLWLQIAGVIGGIVGTVLGVINLWLRIRENQPRLAVVTELEPTREDNETEYRLVVTVRNQSHVPVLVGRLYFEGPHPSQGMTDIRVPETYSGRDPVLAGA